jgi:hypothetical protein
MALFNISIPEEGILINSYSSFWSDIRLPDTVEYSSLQDIVNKVLNGENAFSLLENASYETYAMLCNLMQEYDSIIERINRNIHFESCSEGSIFKPKSRIKEYDDVFHTMRCNKKNNLHTERCTICIDEFKSNQICRKTCEKCVFHALCIDTWILNSKDKTCPNCKRMFNC